MTRYGDDIDMPGRFPEQDVEDTLAEVLARHGLRQLHVAETEKYAHVTYFFNGGREDEWPGETRILVPSPRDVPSYDYKPEMSAREVADAVRATRSGRATRFARRQLRQPGHGRPHRRRSRPSSRRSRRPTPASARSSSAVTRAGGVCLVTADHGNAEQMLEAGRRQPAHGAHDEPGSARGHRSRGELATEGELADLAPDGACAPRLERIRR